jgi:hypothetical protein
VERCDSEHINNSESQRRGAAGLDGGRVMIYRREAEELSHVMVALTSCLAKSVS